MKITALPFSGRLHSIHRIDRCTEIPCQYVYTSQEYIFCKFCKSCYPLTRAISKSTSTRVISSPYVVVYSGVQSQKRRRTVITRPQRHPWSIIRHSHLSLSLFFFLSCFHPSLSLLFFSSLPIHLLDCFVFSSSSSFPLSLLQIQPRKTIPLGFPPPSSLLGLSVLVSPGLDSSAGYGLYLPPSILPVFR